MSYDRATHGTTTAGAGGATISDGERGSVKADGARTTNTEGGLVFGGRSMSLGTRNAEPASLLSKDVAEWNLLISAGCR